MAEAGGYACRCAGYSVKDYHLHHLGYLVADLEAAAARMMLRYGYIQESAAIVDELQTARVLFLRLPAASSWIELLTPYGEASKLANALTKGIVLHHICYEVPDLDEAWRNLRKQGLFPLSAPGPGAAFPGRQIAWMVDDARSLVELVSHGTGPLSVHALLTGAPSARASKILQ